MYLHWLNSLILTSLICVNAVTGTVERKYSGVNSSDNEIDSNHEKKESIKSVEKTIEAELNVKVVNKACECIQYNCGCCQHLEEPSIHLNSTICTNATYLSEDIGISVTVTVDDYTIFNETVSVRNPPPICLGVPYVKEWAEACVRFYDIEATRSHLHACAKVEARMKHVLIAKYNLGCFDIGPVKSTSNIEQKFKQEQPIIILI